MCEKNKDRTWAKDGHERSKRESDHSRNRWWTAAPIWRLEASTTWGSFFGGDGRPSPTNDCQEPLNIASAVWKGCCNAERTCWGKEIDIYMRERVAAWGNERRASRRENVGWVNRAMARGSGYSVGWRHTLYLHHLAPPAHLHGLSLPSRLVAAYHTSVKRHSVLAMKSLYVRVRTFTYAFCVRTCTLCVRVKACV